VLLVVPSFWDRFYLALSLSGKQVTDLICLQPKLSLSSNLGIGVDWASASVFVEYI